jgi:hypothetical protein
MKAHDLKTVTVNHAEIKYFYTREKNDRNGNPRFKIYIIDPESLAVYETIARTYDGLIDKFVIDFVERG